MYNAVVDMEYLDKGSSTLKEFCCSTESADNVSKCRLLYWTQLLQ